MKKRKTKYKHKKTLFKYTTLKKSKLNHKKKTTNSSTIKQSANNPRRNPGGANLLSCNIQREGRGRLV
jgi:hypothetical protein